MIDRPWSPAEVEERLARGTEALDDAVLEYGGMSERAARAKASHDVAYAKALLASRVREPKWPLDAHKAQAMVDVADERFERELAEALMGSQRQVIESLRARCEVLRTLLVQSRNGQDRRY